MEGFVEIRVSPVVRRLITRGLAVVPAVCVLAVAGERATMPLLVASQVILSLQLPFAIVPLIRLTSSPAVMGARANPWGVRISAIACAALVILADVALVGHIALGMRGASPISAYALLAFAGASLAFLGWVATVPLRGESVAPDRPPSAPEGKLVSGGAR